MCSIKNPPFYACVFIYGSQTPSMGPMWSLRSLTTHSIKARQETGSVIGSALCVYERTKKLDHLTMFNCAGGQGQQQQTSHRRLTVNRQEGGFKGRRSCESRGCSSTVLAGWIHFHPPSICVIIHWPIC